MSAQSHHATITVLLMLGLSLGFTASGSAQAAAPPPTPIRLGILGDSDSHSYQDTVARPRGHEPYKAVTFQWGEVLERLRPQYLDLGEWGVWGTRGKIAEAWRWLGLEGRYPKKEDYEYNLAFSGAECYQLIDPPFRYADTLARIIEREPQAWRDGLVVIRIGVNSVGQEPHLNRYAMTGLSELARRGMDSCVAYIADAIRVLREAQPEVNIVVCGMLNSANWVPWLHLWRSRTETENIEAALDYFDENLRRLTEDDPHMAFLDDRAWFRKVWGGRSPEGLPAYRAVDLGGEVSIANTQGDHPANRLIGDGHAGTVMNALWADHLIRAVNQQFGYAIPPLLDSEIAALVDPEGTYGIAPPSHSAETPDTDLRSSSDS